MVRRKAKVEEEAIAVSPTPQLILMLPGYRTTIENLEDKGKPIGELFALVLAIANAHPNATVDFRLIIDGVDGADSGNSAPEDSAA